MMLGGEWLAVALHKRVLVLGSGDEQQHFGPNYM